MASETWNVRRLLEWTEEFLRKRGMESPRLEAQILLAHVLGCKKIDLYVRHQEEPPEDKRAAFREIIKKRADGMPVAYLVGFREFFSLEFVVTPAVLIPRPETETLVVEALRILKPMIAPRVLDLGTGSGAIAVTLAHQHKTARITAVDVSPTALGVAAGNAAKRGVAERIAFVEGDLFAPVTGQTFDVIVSNPPYIAEAEFAALDIGVRDFEPRLALHGGLDGLDFYRRIALESPVALAPAGTILVEIGATQESAVRDLFAPNLSLGPTFKDTAGRPRVITARRRSVSGS
jgi:release factor glutamine methyltransferase